MPADATGERRVPHAILVGLPGAGKTTAGRRAARILKREFLDFDDEIARREGISVAEIFSSKGESYFRERERDLSREVAKKNGMVIAPGGGWICQPGAVELLGGTGRTIYLRVTPEAVFKRLRRIAARPTVSGEDPLEKLRELYRQRHELYERADVVIDAETLTKEEMAAEVARVVAAF